MDPGVATLTDDAISLQGDARPDADLETLFASAKSPPTGARVDRLDIKPPRVSPYIWSASRKGEMIALEGFIPTGEARARILSSAAGKAAGRRQRRDAHRLRRPAGRLHRRDRRRA